MSSGSISRHPIYFFEGDGRSHVVFQVENTLFSLNRDLITKGSTGLLGNMVTVRQPGLPEGSSDTRPMILSNLCKKEDFATFVSILLWDNLDPNLDTWITALKLASTFGFEGVRRLALVQIGSQYIRPMEKLRMARLCAPEWEESSLVFLCQRFKPLSNEALEILGNDEFIRLSRVREEYRTIIAKGWWPCAYQQTCGSFGTMKLQEAMQCSTNSFGVRSIPEFLMLQQRLAPKAFCSMCHADFGQRVELLLATERCKGLVAPLLHPDRSWGRD